jgi:outer membrane protein assembly factor BamB
MIGDSFDEFSAEMGDYEMEKMGEFDRVWKVEYGGSISGNIRIHNDVAYFSSTNHLAYAIDLNTGKLIWKFKTFGTIIEGAILVNDNIAYFGSFDKNMYAVSADEGKLVWKYKTGDKIAGAAAYSDGLIYFGGKDNFLYALVAKTGELAWKYKTFTAIICEPTIVGEKVMIGGYDHFIYCLDKKKGTLIWRLKTQGEIHGPTQMPVRDGILYCSSFDNNIRAIDIETGKLVWKKEIGHFGCEGQPGLYKDFIFYTSRDGMFYTLNMKGEILWKLKTKEVPGEPRAYEDKIYLGSDDHYMRCISLDGKVLWKFKAMHNVWYGVEKQGNKIIFGSWDCNVYCIDENTQKLIWKFHTGGSPAPIPESYAQFEMQMVLPEVQVEEKKKSYDLILDEESNENTSTYKSRITYQISTQYGAKGKYQVDSMEEEF